MQGKRARDLAITVEYTFQLGKRGIKGGKLGSKDQQRGPIKIRMASIP